MMRKRLYQLFNILASYPVLILLITGIGVLAYAAGQYQPLEQLQARKQEMRMQLKQKRQGMVRELADVEMVDLAKRYELFNKNFLERSDMEGESLSEQFAPTLKYYGWGLERLERVLADGDANGQQLGVRIEGALFELEAMSLWEKDAQDEPFLPLYSMTQATRFLWARPPTKEYQRIKLSRLEEGYLLEVTMFMPLQDIDSSSEPEKEESI